MSVDVDLLVQELVGVLVLLLVDALAFTVKALLVLPLLVVDVLLKAVVHLEGGVEPVFDRVVSSAGHVLRDQGPLLAVLEVQVHQLLVLVEGPLVACNVGIEMVVPPFTALFPNTTWEHGSDVVPALRTMLNNHDLEPLVLLLGPGTFLAALDLILLLKAEILEIRRLDVVAHFVLVVWQVGAQLVLCRREVAVHLLVIGFFR